MNDPAFWEQRYHGLLRIAHPDRRPNMVLVFHFFLAAWMVLLVPVERGPVSQP